MHPPQTTHDPTVPPIHHGFGITDHRARTPHPIIPSRSSPFPRVNVIGVGPILAVTPTACERQQLRPTIGTITTTRTNTSS